MKFKWNLVGVTCAVILSFCACSKEEKKVEKDDSSIQPAVQKGAKGKPDVKAQAADKKISALKKPSLNPAAGVPPKGMTMKELFKEQKVPEVVAVVGDRKITRDALIKEIEAQLPPQMRNQPLPPQMTAALAQNLKNAVETMINRQLLIQLAAADGIKPSAKMLIDEMNAELAKMPPQQKLALEQQLKAKGSSLAQQKEMAAKDTGAQENGAIKKWIDSIIVPKVKVDEAAALKFYRDNQIRFKQPASMKVAHILIALDKVPAKQAGKMTKEDTKKFMEAADKKAKSAIDKIADKLKKGGDFAALAKENSACPSKTDGGKLSEAFDINGRIIGADPRAGGMDSVFAKAAFTLKPGELSKPVKTQFGYHIIKAIEKNKESFVPFKDVKANITAFLEKEKVGKLLRASLEAAKAKAKVKIFVK